MRFPTAFIASLLVLVTLGQSCGQGRKPESQESKEGSYGWRSSVECEGYNSETGNSVSGECEDGSFAGYDSETGNYVYGDCEPGGDLEAYDSETGHYVYGECEDK